SPSTYHLWAPYCRRLLRFFHLAGLAEICGTGAARPFVWRNVGHSGAIECQPMVVQLVTLPSNRKVAEPVSKRAAAAKASVCAGGRFSNMLDDRPALVLLDTAAAGGL